MTSRRPAKTLVGVTMLTTVIRVLPVLLTVLLAPAALPQETPEPPPARETVTAESLEDLIATLEDPDDRAALLDRLRVLLDALQPEAAPPPPEALGIESLAGFFRRLSERLSDTAARLAEQLAALPDGLRRLGARLRDDQQRAALLREVGLVLAVVGAAAVAALLLRLAVRGLRRRLGWRQRSTPFGLGIRIWRSFVRLFVDLAPPVLALVVGFTLAGALPLAPRARTLAVATVGATAIHAAGRALISALFAPRSGEIRLLPIDDSRAGALAAVLRKALSVAVWGWFVLAAAGALADDPDLLDALRNVYALALLIVAVTLILRIRTHVGAGAATTVEAVTAEPEPPEPVAEELAAEEDADAGSTPPAATRAARVRRRQRAVAWRTMTRAALGLWWVIALVYVVGLYLLWVSGIEDGFATALEATLLTVVWVGAAVLAVSLVNGLLARTARRVMVWTAPIPSLRRQVPRWFALLRTVLDAAIAVVAAGFVLEAWGVGAIALLDSAVVRTVLSTVLGILLIVLLTLAVIDVSTALTTSYLARKQLGSADSAKIRTLVPLANKAIRVTMTVLAVLMILAQLGVAVGPILASVGFIGLAIGFGAQTLVKDLISGVFNLLEDNVSVGDVVSIAGTGGAVEAINIRTIQLRDLSGNVHTFPWGQVDKITNLTKEYGRYVIECGVAYREDTDEVVRVLREIGAELQRDPVHGPKILEPLEVLGVDRFEESRVVVTARLKTRPIEQWSVGREFNRRMKKAFDARGIEMPRPHRTIYMGEEKGGGAPPLRVVRVDEDAAAREQPSG